MKIRRRSTGSLLKMDRKQSSKIWKKDASLQRREAAKRMLRPLAALLFSLRSPEILKVAL
jgi:hypothetical protein